MSLDRTGKDDGVISSPCSPLVRSWFVLAVFFLILCGSCSTDRLKGRLVLSGSATLAPLVANSVELWKKFHPGVEVTVEAIGSDAGLERLIRYSDADLALVSRPLTPADQDAAKTAGKVLVALPLAWDAVCLVVPASNTWVRSLSRGTIRVAPTSVA